MYTPILPRPGATRDSESLDKVIPCVPVTGIPSSNNNTDDTKETTNEMACPILEEAMKDSASPTRPCETASEAQPISISSPSEVKDFAALDINAILEIPSDTKAEGETASDGAGIQEKKTDRPKPLSSGLLDWQCLRYSPGLLDPKFLASFLETNGNLPHPAKNQLVTLLNNIRGEIPDLVIHIGSSQQAPHFPLSKSEEQKFHPAMGPQPVNWAAYQNQLQSSMALDRVDPSQANASYLNWTGNIPLDSMPSWKANMFAPPPAQSNHLWQQNGFPAELFERNLSKQPNQKQSYLKNPLLQYNPKVPSSRLLASNDASRGRKGDPNKRDHKSTMSVFQQGVRNNQLSSSLVPQGTKSAWSSVGEKKKKGANGTESATTAMRLSEALALIEGGQLEGRFACNGLSLPEVCPYPGCGFLINNEFEKLQAHVASHNPTRPFECSECPSSFHRGQDLVRHRRIHLQIRPYKCPNCPKAFGRRDAQQRHTNRLNCAPTGSTGYGSELNATQS